MSDQPQSPFGTPDGFGPPAEQHGQQPAGRPARAPGDEVWSGVDVTPSGPARRRPRGRTIGAVAGTAVLVAGLAVGGTIAVNALGGGGSQPEQHLPATALGVVKLDLDPSVSQKLDAVRFLSRLPGAQDEVRNDSDLRAVLYKQATQDVKGAPPWSQAKTWVGDRLAIGILAGHDAKLPFEAVVVLQVRDEQAARDGLAEATEQGTGVTVHGGWATVARTQALADTISATDPDRSLAQDVNYRADLAKLGEQGIAGGWADTGKAISVISSFAGDPGEEGIGLGGAAALEPLKQSLSAFSGEYGRVAMTVRFDGPQLELAAAVTGVKARHQAATNTIRELPADTLVALSTEGLGQEFQAAWPKLKQQPQLRGMAEGSGLDLPGDVVALLGDRTQFALAPSAKGAYLPSLGIKVASTDSRLPHALKAVIQAPGQLFQQRKLKGGYVLSTDAAQADALAGGKGGLGATAGFASVLPDVATAQTAVFVNLAAIAASPPDAASLEADDKALLKQLGAAGLTAHFDADGTGRISVRVGVR